MFVKFLNDYSSPQLQFEAIWALTNIASGTTENTQTVVNSGAITSLIQLLGISTSPDVIAQSIWCLGNIAGDSAQFRDDLLFAGVVDPILKIISGNPKISILRNAVWCLSNLCRGKPAPEIKFIAPSVPILCSLLSLKDADILIDACWTFSYISDGSNNKIDLIIQQGAIPSLISLLSHSSDNIVEPALRTIGNIVSGDDLQTDVFIKAKGLPVVAKLFKSSKRAIRKEAVWTISNVTAGNKSQIQAVIDENIIPKLLTLASLNTTTEAQIVAEALWAIANISVVGTKEQIEYLVSKGVLKTFKDIFDEKNNFTIKPLVEALENIFLTDEKYIKSFEEIGGKEILSKIQIDKALKDEEFLDEMKMMERDDFLPPLNFTTK